MTKEETLALAAAHVAAGGKIIFALHCRVRIGYIVRRWSASRSDRPRWSEIVDDQPLVVVRESTFEEFVKERPAQFPGPTRQATPAEIASMYFYEMQCE